MPTPAQQTAVDQLREKQRQQLQVKRAKQTAVDAQLESMQKAIAAQKTELDSLKTLVEINKKDILRTLDTKMSKLET